MMPSAGENIVAGGLYGPAPIGHRRGNGIPSCIVARGATRAKSMTIKTDAVSGF
ncbi:hypothetical protein [Streptomyces sp. 35G-GA-8]|uniref:hypothetical protein n=1 Tax=Streptomyces sp. 35G-GA-8 TaxID=2939434 RepID=UPI00201F32CF|nr:hypothetical protein [Streptomyces sp. 35G-GA-8]MCL7379849.1 hypothetical protein [Streptomyces sp. 35G-GA-8]